jgi:hypothetical protein
MKTLQTDTRRGEVPRLIALVTILAFAFAWAAYVVTTVPEALDAIACVQGEQHACSRMA